MRNWTDASLTVVGTVCAVLIIDVLAMILLAVLGRPVPDTLKDIGNASLVAITALLAQTSQRGSKVDEPQPVVIHQPAADPVPVDPTPTGG